MKSTEVFKLTIKKYLDDRAAEDNLFAITYKKENKNIDDCITCILNTVQKSGCNGFTDDQVYSMAIHYYTEDNIEIGKSMDCEVVVNHKVKLTAEEITEAKEKAIRELIDAEKKTLRAPIPTIKKEEVKTVQTLMFQ